MSGLLGNRQNGQEIGLRDQDTVVVPVEDEELDATTGEFELSERQALRRVPGLSTELTDITEVEYRQLRLERVVLVGVWTEGTQTDAENSLTELAALAETAGSQVLEGLIQRRDRPDPATYIGRGKVDDLGSVVLATAPTRSSATVSSLRRSCATSNSGPRSRSSTVRR